MKSFKFTIFYDLETKVKVLMIIQWNFFGNRSIFERAACFWKETVVLGTQCTWILNRYKKWIIKVLIDTRMWQFLRNVTEFSAKWWFECKWRHVLANYCQKWHFWLCITLCQKEIKKSWRHKNEVQKAKRGLGLFIKKVSAE